MCVSNFQVEKYMKVQRTPIVFPESILIEIFARGREVQCVRGSTHKH